MKSSSTLLYSRANRNHGIVFSGQIAITAPSDTDSVTLINNLRSHLSLKYPFRVVTNNQLIAIEAEKKGMTAQAFVDRNRDHPGEELMRPVGDAFHELAKHNWVVGKSPLAHIYMQHSFRVLLTSSTLMRARRRARDRFPNFTPQNVEDMLTEIDDHDRRDAARYDLQFPGCNWEPADFDFVINVEDSGVVITAGAIIERHQAWIKTRADKGEGAYTTKASMGF